MKGIILAGGSGTRLFPMTRSVSKQILPVYDKPMIYYPLTTLMLAGIEEILVISTPEDLPLFQNLLGDGSQWGLSLSYAEQPRPEGLAQAFVIGADYIDGGPVCLILGDNIFYGHGLTDSLGQAAAQTQGATIFGYWVKDPERYGVIEFDKQRQGDKHRGKTQATSIQLGGSGHLFLRQAVVELAENLEPSPRGEIEITDLTRSICVRVSSKCRCLGRGIAWLDAGTHKSLLQAANFVQAVEDRQGMMISCVEEIAYRKGFIDAQQLF